MVSNELGWLPRRDNGVNFLLNLAEHATPVRHTGVTTGSSVLQVIENKKLWRPDL